MHFPEDLDISRVGRVLGWVLSLFSVTAYHSAATTVGLYIHI